MKKSLAATIAAAALIAGAGLANAQQKPPEGAGGMQSPPAMGPSERHGPMQGQTQGRSAAEEKTQKHPGQTGTMEKGTRQGRSAAEEKMEKHPGQTGTMEKGTHQGRSAAGEKMEKHPGQTGTMEKGVQGGSATGGRLEQRPGQAGTVQGQRQGRAGVEQNRGVTTEQRSAASSVQLSQDQRTRIREVVTTSNLHHVTRVDFPIKVGTRVPRTVALNPVPQSIIEIVPQYRGFDYIVVENDLIIIDPVTLQIVAILPVG